MYAYIYIYMYIIYTWYDKSSRWLMKWRTCRPGAQLTRVKIRITLVQIYCWHHCHGQNLERWFGSCSRSQGILLGTFQKRVKGERETEEALGDLKLFLVESVGLISVILLRVDCGRNWGYNITTVGKAMIHYDKSFGNGLYTIKMWLRGWCVYCLKQQIWPGDQQNTGRTDPGKEGISALHEKHLESWMPPKCGQPQMYRLYNT